MLDHRMRDKNGRRVAFTCTNSRFRTNTAKGKAHRPFSRTRGAVFPEPLVAHGGYTLWLEHVIDHKSGEQCYWLMWYDGNGRPTIPMSGIFEKPDLVHMARLVASLVP